MALAALQTVAARPPRGSAAELVKGVNRTKIGTAMAPDRNLLDRKILEVATGSIDFVAT